MQIPLRVARLLETMARSHPRSATGVLESRAVDPAVFDRITDEFLAWGETALGPDFIVRGLEAFAGFSSAVNLAQGRYEASGAYEHRSYEECRRAVYDDPESMTDYMWGIYLSNVLWPHHLDLMRFYEDRFVSRLEPGARLVEFAPGHGGWGLWALRNTRDTHLEGFDISATAVQIASNLARAAGLESRAKYSRSDALVAVDTPSPAADAVICCFLVEHLEQPSALMASISHVLAPGGVAFFTGALTAAQVDHIFEFRFESELVKLAEDAGLRVLETRSVAPVRRLARARFLPRSMALVLQKRTQSTW